jgi:F-type H+-transporting ATPase subunit delta
MTMDRRASRIDGAVKEHEADERLVTDLFETARILDENPLLRRSLSDPSATLDSRQGLAGAVFGEALSQPARSVLEAAMELSWPSSGSFTTAIRRQGVRALFLWARNAAVLDDVIAEVFDVATLVRSTPELNDALTRTTIPIERRHALLDDLLANRVHPQSLLLLRQALGEWRHTFDDTIMADIEIATAMSGRSFAVARTSTPLSAEQLERLQRALQANLGREVVVETLVDPSLIGGIRIEVDSEIIDGSVLARLDEARRQFT